MEKTANQIMQVLLGNQFKAYLVGGYVRDLLLNRHVSDIDIATSALPQQVVQLFSHTVPTGLQHGTVTVIMDGNSFEVTTFRQESDYEKHRRPKQVEFVTDLETDLQRRDFTMNAMAMDVSGAILDPFNGQEDIRQRLVRCVGQAMDRFQEDALRMLRCIRFSANYRFQIEAETWKGLLLNKALLQHIAMERVRVELEKMIAGNDPHLALELLLESGLLQHLKVNLQLPINDWTKEQIPASWKRLNELSDPLLRWGILFKSMDVSSEAASRALRKLTLSSKQCKFIVNILKLNQWLEDQVEEAKDQLGNLADKLEMIWKRAAVDFGKVTLQSWLQIIRLEQQPMKSAFASFSVHGNDWISEMPVEILTDIDITGNDLITFFKLPPGPWVSEMLHRLLLDAAFGNVRNQMKYLLQRAQIYRKELKKHE